MSIVRFLFRVSLFNKPDLVVVLLLYLLLVVSVVVGTEVIGVRVRLRSEVWWQDSEYLPSISQWDDVSWSDLDRRGCRVSDETWSCDPLTGSGDSPAGEVVRMASLWLLLPSDLRGPRPVPWQELCLLISGGVQEYAIVTTRPTLNWVHIVELGLNIYMLLHLVLLTIHSIGAPGFKYHLFLLGYVWIVSSSITISPADKKIPKPSEMCHLFLLVTYVQYRQHFCLVIMVVTANSGEVVWEAQVYAFEAFSVTYQMASMLVGEVEHNYNYLCCIWIRNGFEYASKEGVTAFPFEMFHRWRVRASSLLVLRFNGRDKLQLSSVKLPKNLQLGSFQPQVHKPIRTLGEPPGYYRRAHVEALEYCGCGCASVFSPDPPSGSFRSLHSFSFGASFRTSLYVAKFVLQNFACRGSSPCTCALI